VVEPVIPALGKAEAREPKVQGRPGLHSETCLRKKKKRKEKKNNMGI
jgi:hypothetical protein